MSKDGVSEAFKAELTFSEESIQDNQKNYQVWHHRKMLVCWAAGYDENTKVLELSCPLAKKKLRDQELELTYSLLLSHDPKNYHVWQHRQWILQVFK